MYLCSSFTLLFRVKVIAFYYMSRREKPEVTKEEKAFYAGFEAARARPVRNDIVNLYREYLKKIRGGV